MNGRPLLKLWVQDPSMWPKMLIFDLLRKSPILVLPSRPMSGRGGVSGVGTSAGGASPRETGGLGASPRARSGATGGGWAGGSVCPNATTGAARNAARTTPRRKRFTMPPSKRNEPRDLICETDEPARPEQTRCHNPARLLGGFIDGCRGLCSPQARKAWASGVRRGVECRKKGHLVARNCPARHRPTAQRAAQPPIIVV